MFRHKNMTDPIVENKTTSEEKTITPVAAPVVLEKKNESKTSVSKTDTEILKELLEKNLKWSQIIYEQNRKINNKLMWSTIFSWLRVMLILIPLGLAAWFLPPVVKNLQNTYGDLIGGKATTAAPGANSMDQLLKLLPLDPAKQEQLKALLK